MKIFLEKEALLKIRQLADEFEGGVSEGDACQVTNLLGTGARVPSGFVREALLDISNTEGELQVAVQFSIVMTCYVPLPDNWEADAEENWEEDFFPLDATALTLEV